MIRDVSSVLAKSNNQLVKKTKPRYTKEENEIIFNSWWDPQQRKELTTRLGREMRALRSQFCRLLKAKELTIDQYYRLMQEKTTANLKSTQESVRHKKDLDQQILETFCKHQALGNTRNQACEELQEQLEGEFSEAALKLRFYRLVNKQGLNEDDLLKMGKEVLSFISEKEPITDEERKSMIEMEAQVGADPFLQQISFLPETVRGLEERIRKLEEQQKTQLDLRGFIEHLLAVERDLKKEDKLLEEIQRLVDEKEHFRLLREKDLERIAQREEELNGVYEMLNQMLSNFMKLESVPKLASLGDFMHSLEITVDQFGNVMKHKRIYA